MVSEGLVGALALWLYSAPALGVVAVVKDSKRLIHSSMVALLLNFSVPSLASVRFSNK